MITNENKSTKINSTYSLFDEIQVCQIPDSIATKALSLIDGKNHFFVDYSFICSSVLCPSLNRTTCTQMKYKYEAANSDSIAGTVVIYSCKSSRCQTEEKVLLCQNDGTWNDTEPQEICITPIVPLVAGNWSSWNITNCTISISQLNSSTNLSEIVNIAMTASDCENIETSQNQETSTINIRNQATQASLATISQNLDESLQKLNVEYQTITKIANSGSILVGVLTGVFLVFILSSDLLNVVRFILGTECVMELINKLELVEMQPHELDSRWKKTFNFKSRFDLYKVEELDVNGLITKSESLSSLNNSQIDNRSLRFNNSKPTKMTSNKSSKINLPIIEV